MDKIVGWLSGAPGAANNAGGYYNTAMNNDVNSTGTGSPLATTFGNQEAAALQPRFDQQNQALAAKEAAMGITSSGAAKADYTQLGADQAATLTGSIAPLYSNAESQYGAINAAMPGAQNNAYQNAIQNFYQGVSDASSLAAGVPASAPKPGAVDQSSAVYNGSTTNPAGVSTIDNPAEMYPDYNPYAVTTPPPSQYFSPTPAGGGI